MMQIRAGGLSDPKVIELVGIHRARARDATEPGSSHALDASGLQAPDVSVWTLWDGEDLLGIGALKRLDPRHGEVKSMHTAEAARRRGVGAAMLRHIISEARKAGLARLSLETGSWDYFQPARTLYRTHGFVECPPFGSYQLDHNSIFMTLSLR